MSVRSQRGSDTMERTEPSPVAGVSSESSFEFITVLCMGRADCTQQKATSCSLLPHPHSMGRTALKCPIFISILYMEIVSLTCNFHVHNTAWMHILNPKTNSQQPKAIPWLTAPWVGRSPCLHSSAGHPAEVATRDEETQHSLWSVSMAPSHCRGDTQLLANYFQSCFQRHDGRSKSKS